MLLVSKKVIFYDVLIISDFFFTKKDVLYIDIACTPNASKVFCQWNQTYLKLHLFSS